MANKKPLTSEERLDRIERLLEESLRSNEAFRRSTEEFRRSTEEFRRSTEEFIAESRRQTARFGELLGNIGNTIGMTVESQGFRIVSRYLKQKEGLSVRFQHRKIFRLGGTLREVDLLGEAQKNGRKLTFPCECKARTDRKDVEDFAQTLQLIKPRLQGTVRPILFTYDVRRGARESARRFGITLVTPFDVSP